MNDVETDCTYTSGNECANESDIEKEGKTVILGDEDRNSYEESVQELYEFERMIEEVVREMEMGMC